MPANQSSQPGGAAGAAESRRGRAAEGRRRNPTELDTFPSAMTGRENRVGGKAILPFMRSRSFRVAQEKDVSSGRVLFALVD